MFSNLFNCNRPVLAWAVVRIVGIVCYDSHALPTPEMLNLPSDTWQYIIKCF